MTRWITAAAPIVIAYATWAVFVIAWNVFDRSARTTTAVGPRGERLYSLVIAAGIVMLVLSPLQLAGGPTWRNPPVFAWAMLLVLAGGIAWCVWARQHLGALWSASVTRKEGHRVVSTGPYRLVRHPIYTGMLVMYVSIALISTAILAVLAVPVMTLGLWLKARVEERFLSEELGAAAYGAYQARTPMLVPRLPR